MIPLAADFLFVTGLMVVGAWLERIGGMNGLIDELLTPFPLGLSGLALVFFETAIA